MVSLRAVQNPKASVMNVEDVGRLQASDTSLESTLLTQSMITTHVKATRYSSGLIERDPNATANYRCG